MVSVVDEVFHQEIFESGLDIEKKAANSEFDDDQKPRRTGNVWTASAHIITSTIGSGVLSLAWCVAQLGWLAGVSSLLLFSAITLYTTGLLADCYRSPDPITGKRNYTYMEVVKATLGPKMYVVCGMVQHATFIGMIIGYTITTSISIVAIRRSDCFHNKGHESACRFSQNQYMIGLGIIEILLSQIPSFHNLSLLSFVAAFMSFGYSAIGMGLAFAKVVAGKGEQTTLTGVAQINLPTAEKAWRMFAALGDIAFAYTYCQVLIEIQDTLKSSPPENKTMKKANMIAILTTTSFYMMCGCFGYAAFGDNAPGNLLTGFGFYEPFWLVDLANICIVVHLVGAYQVFSQPVFSAFESWASRRWPKSKFVTEEYPITVGISKKYKLNINFLRLTGRTIYVIVLTVLAMALPFFNDILALIGALGYWPMTVYFPIQMYVSQKKIRRWSMRWLGLQGINLLCLLVALAAALGSIQGIGQALHAYKPFKVNE